MLKCSTKFLTVGMIGLNFLSVGLAADQEEGAEEKGAPRYVSRISAEDPRLSLISDYHIREVPGNGKFQVLLNDPWAVREFESHEEALGFASASIKEPLNLEQMMVDHGRVWNFMLPHIGEIKESLSGIKSLGVTQRLKEVSSLKNKLFDRISDHQENKKEFIWDFNINDTVGFRFYAHSSEEVLEIKDRVAQYLNKHHLLTNKFFMRSNDKDQTWFIRGLAQEQVSGRDVWVEIQVLTLANLRWMEWMGRTSYKMPSDLKKGPYHKGTFKPYKDGVLRALLNLSSNQGFLGDLPSERGVRPEDLFDWGSLMREFMDK